jgi:hypothetical protein
MKPRHVKVLISLIVLGVVAALFSNCAMYDPGAFGQMVINGKAIEIRTKNDTVTLAWDPPDTPTAAYRIYYRVHGTLAWTLLDEVPAAPNPEYVLNIAQFGEGSFDFGVSSIDPSDQESNIHTSLDITADPTSGWYLIWSQ